MASPIREGQGLHTTMMSTFTNTGDAPGLSPAVPFRQLLDGLQHPALVLSDQTRVVWLNAAAIAAFGLQPGDDLFRTIRGRGDIFTTCPESEEGGKNPLRTWRIGTRLYAVDKATLPSADGAPYLFLILSDITGQRGRTWAEETEGGGATFWVSFANPPSSVPMGG